MKMLTQMALVLVGLIGGGCDGASMVGPNGGGGIGMPAPEPGAFTCGGKGCPTLKITGRIVEGEGTPVSSAIVSVWPGTVVDTTGTDGRYSLDWPSFTEACRDWSVDAAHSDGTVQADTVHVCYSAELDFKF